MKRILSLILFVVILAGCKMLKTGPDPALKPMPESFGGTKDSAKTSLVNWKTYFSDSILSALIDTALKNNLDVLIAAQRIEAAKNYVSYRSGLLWPALAAQVSAGQKRFGKYTMDGVGNYDTRFSPNISKDEIIPEHLPDYFVGLTSTWEIDIWGKLKSRRKEALCRYLASVEGRNWLVTNLVAEIAATYYSLLALDNELEIISETIALQEDALEIIRYQKQAGQANELAVKQFEAQLLHSKSLETETRQKIIESESRISYLMGEFPRPVKRHNKSFAQQIPLKAEQGIPSDLLRNRPDIKQAELELIATGANLKAARAAFYPSLNINGTLGFQAFNAAFLFSPQSLAYNILGSLTAPLINRSAIKASFNTAKANQTEAFYNYQKSILNGYVEVYNQVANLRNLDQIYTNKNREVEVLTESISTSSALFKTGRATYLEIVMTQRNALYSKLELVDLKKRQFNTLINIYKALGGGWR